MRIDNFSDGLEQTSKSDSFMAKHTAKFVIKGRGIPFYLSSTIANDFITQLADHVKIQDAQETSNAMYYSIIVCDTLWATYLHYL